MTTVIDLTDPAWGDALTDWAEALARQDARLTVPEVPAEGDVVSIDQVCIGSEIRLLNEWHRVQTKVTRTDEHGHRLTDLVVCDGSRPSWEYPVLEGESFTVRASF